MNQRAIELLRVGFDLDGILSRTELPVLAALKAAGLVADDTGPDDLEHFDYSASFPSVPREFVASLFREGDVFRLAPCDPAGLHCLNTLTDLGVETHIVTHRPWNRARIETQEWLHKFEAHYSHLHFVKERADKAAYCRQAGLDMFIEDNLETAEMLTQHVRLSMLFDRSYNHDPTRYGGPGVIVGHPLRAKIKRFYRFDEVLAYFGVLSY